MKTIYLINCQDRYCPENNNGDNILEAYSTLSVAQKRVDFLNKKKDLWEYFIMEKGLDCTEQEYLDVKYPKEEK